MEISKKLKKSIPRSPFCRPSHFWRTHIVLVLPYHFWLLAFHYSFLTMYLLFTGRKWLLIARGMDLSPHISFGRKISSGWTSSKLNKVIHQSYFDLKLFHVQPTVQNIIRLSDIIYLCPSLLSIFTFLNYVFGYFQSTVVCWWFPFEFDRIWSDVFQHNRTSWLTWFICRINMEWSRDLENIMHIWNQWEINSKKEHSDHRVIIKYTFYFILVNEESDFKTCYVYFKLRNVMAFMCQTIYHRWFKFCCFCRFNLSSRSVFVYFHLTPSFF